VALGGVSNAAEACWWACSDGTTAGRLSTAAEACCWACSDSTTAGRLSTAAEAVVALGGVSTARWGLSDTAEALAVGVQGRYDGWKAVDGCRGCCGSWRRVDGLLEAVERCRGVGASSGGSRKRRQAKRGAIDGW
jgi:hypothetical protein